MSTFTYGFYNSIDGDRKYDAIQMSEIFDGLINDGVYATIGDCFIVKAYPDEDDSVVVGSGRAWLDHTWNKLDDPLIMQGPESDYDRDRIDIIAIEVDKKDRENRITWIKGNPADFPVRPPLYFNPYLRQYPLCTILRKAKSTKIEQQYITNCVGTYEIPFVTGIIETIQGDKLFSQWMNMWDAWFNGTENEWTTWFSEIKKNDISKILSMLDNKVDAGKTLNGYHFKGRPVSPETSGWKRVAKFPSTGASYYVSVGRSNVDKEPETCIFLISLGGNVKPKVTYLSREANANQPLSINSINKALFTNTRLIVSNNDIFLELYLESNGFSGNAAEVWSIDILGNDIEGLNQDGRVPSGYTAYEFPVTQLDGLMQYAYLEHKSASDKDAFLDKLDNPQKIFGNEQDKPFFIIYTDAIGDTELGGGTCLIFGYFHEKSGQYAVQLAIKYGTPIGTMKIRTRYTGTWSAWRTFNEKPTPTEINAVATTANQGLTANQKLNARTNIEGQQTIAIHKKMEESGWHRFATTSNQRCYIIDIKRRYNKFPPENHVLFVDVGNTKAKIREISSNVEAQRTTYFRVAIKNSSIVGFDFYCLDAAELYIINIIPFITNDTNDEPLVTVDFEPNPDTTGYTLIEFTLNNTDDSIAVDKINNLEVTNSTDIGHSNTNKNGIGFVNGLNLFNSISGAMYRQVYSKEKTAHEIFGDYDSGQIAVRGLYNGEWSNWRKILDDLNYTDFVKQLSLQPTNWKSDDANPDEYPLGITLFEYYNFDKLFCGYAVCGVLTIRTSYHTAIQLIIPTKVTTQFSYINEILLRGNINYVNEYDSNISEWGDTVKLVTSDNVVKKGLIKVLIGSNYNKNFIEISGVVHLNCTLTGVSIGQTNQWVTVAQFKDVKNPVKDVYGQAVVTDGGLKIENALRVAVKATTDRNIQVTTPSVLNNVTLIIDIIY